MIIFTLRVDVFAKPARLVDLAHWPESRVEVGRLEHHVLKTMGLCDRLKELIGLFERSPHGSFDPKPVSNPWTFSNSLFRHFQNLERRSRLCRRPFLLRR